MKKQNLWYENRILFYVMIGTFLLLALLNPRSFLKLTTLQSMAFQLPELGLLSLAMMITMLTGGINLSIISTANLTGIVTGVLLVTLSQNIGYGLTIPIALICGMLIAVLIGILNGALIAFLEVSPILATLGTMIFIKGISILVTRGSAISGLNAIEFIGNGSILGVPVPLLIFLAAALALSIYLSKMAGGFHIYMIGSNSQATLYAGINNKKVLIKTYIISSIYAGISSVIMISRFNSAKADYGESYLLITVLAAVLGGTSATGGFGKVSGLVLALIILQMLSGGLNLMRVNAFLTVALWGIIMIGVMVLQYFSKKNQVKKVKPEEESLIPNHLEKPD